MKTVRAKTEVNRSLQAISITPFRRPLVFCKIQTRALPAIDIHGNTMKNPYLRTNSSSSPSNSTPMLNPYRKSANSGNSRNRSNENGGTNNNEINSVVANPSSMGCQSQRGQGSVRKCLKKGSKSKYKIATQKNKGLVQMGVNGGLAFDSDRDCVKCRSVYMQKFGFNVSVSHKAHDIRCRKNRTTRGLSAFTVMVDKYSKKMTTINTMPLSRGHTEGLPSVAKHFGTSPTTITTTTTRTNSTGTTTTANTTSSATNTTTSTSSKEADKDKRQGNKYC
jgi:hypothetical protein